MGKPSTMGTRSGHVRCQTPLRMCNESAARLSSANLEDVGLARAELDVVPARAPGELLARQQVDRFERGRKPECNRDDAHSRALGERIDVDNADDGVLGIRD